MKYYLGLDVGGTNLAAGVVDSEFHLLSKKSRPAGAGRDMDAIIADMLEVSREAVDASGLGMKQIMALGIGMPSYVNPKTGLIVHANCFGWRNAPVYAKLEAQTDLPVYIENDANCAALSEMLTGAAVGCRNAVMLTLGTGVGGGIILDGKIYSGADGMGAELGHTKLFFGGRKCTCGQRGCIDGYCSARGLADTARERIREGSILWELCHYDLRKLEAQMILEAVEEKDDCAVQIWEEYLTQLASAIGNFIAIFRPEMIILGGGVANAGERLLEPLRVKVWKNTFAAEQIGIPEICLARAGNDAGIIGAAMLQRYGAGYHEGKRQRETKGDKL